MTRPLQQTMTAEQEHGLYDALARVRASSSTVKVDREALRNLLHDHGKALAALPDGYLDVNGRPGPRS